MKRLVFKALALVIALVSFAMGVQEWHAISKTQSLGQMAIVQSATEVTRQRSKRLASHSATFTVKTDSGQLVTHRRPAPESVIDAVRNGDEVKVYKTQACKAAGVTSAVARSQLWM